MAPKIQYYRKQNNHLINYFFSLATGTNGAIIVGGPNAEFYCDRSTIHTMVSNRGVSVGEGICLERRE